MAENETELWVWWQRFIGTDRATFDALLSRHREAHRRYHTATHVAWVIRHCRTLLRDRFGDVQTVGDARPTDAIIIAAAFWHDAVYDPTSASNEHASAQLAARDLATLGWGDSSIARVAHAIEGTADHMHPADDAEAVLFDADLAILGAEPRGYADYVDGVRYEYRHVPDDAWRTGRAAVLRSFLTRGHIYATATGRSLWAARAVANLEAELATLG
ncbi:MAG: hypothetical protein HRT86_13370 [Ilumatobacteraceae bacterium]|nr:hypothetical protein [Ilumatobacteraceae bacterium]